jgi:hypothetical protein
MKVVECQQHKSRVWRVLVEMSLHSKQHMRTLHVVITFHTGEKVLVPILNQVLYEQRKRHLHRKHEVNNKIIMCIGLVYRMICSLKDTKEKNSQVFT